jgi:MFS family permease
MNLKAFRTSLVIGLALTFLIVIYPPWFAGVDSTHCWLFSAPRRAVVNWSRLSLYLVAAWIAAMPAGLVWNWVADLPRRKRIMALSLILAIVFLAWLIWLGVEAEWRR